MNTQYDYICPSFSERFFSKKMEEYQNDGWEVCGNLNPYRCGANNSDICISVPMRKKKNNNL